MHEFNNLWFDDVGVGTRLITSWLSAVDPQTGMVSQGRDQVPTWVCHLGCCVDSSDFHDGRFVSVRNW